MRQFLKLALLFGIVSLGGCDDGFEDYDLESDNPGGFDLLPGIVEAAYPDVEVRVVEEGLAESVYGEEAPLLYILIGDGISLNEEESEALWQRVSSGQHIVLASRVVSRSVLEYACARDSLEFGQWPFMYQTDLAYSTEPEGHTQQVELRGPWQGEAVEFGFLFGAESGCLTLEEPEIFLRNPGREVDEAPRLLGTYREEESGGTLTFLSEPLLMSNIYATHPDGRAFFNTVLSQLDFGQEEVWLDVSYRRNAIDVISENQAEGPGGGRAQDRTPSALRHLLDRPPLAAAWYSLQVAALLFLIFSARRRQRPIPLVHAHRNTAREHLENISRLYRNRPSNTLMARKQLRLFEAFTQRRFNLKPLASPEDLERLGKMRGIDPNRLAIFQRYSRSIQRAQLLSDGALVKLVNELRRFYKEVRQG